MPEPSPEAVEALFQQAADLDPEERGAFLEKQCDGDFELLVAVEELLHFGAKAEGTPDFLQGPAAAVRAALLPAAGAVPSHIGRYRILRRLGEGGMGTVYEAQQEQPRRIVALKVIRPGLLSSQLVRRFRHEAQILAPASAPRYRAGL